MSTIIGIVVALLVAAYLVIKFYGRHVAVNYLVEAHKLDRNKLKHLKDIEITGLTFDLDNNLKKGEYVKYETIRQLFE